jgi:hypothetical protein
MTSEAEKKIEFILAWYNGERGKFGFVKQIMLAKTWIDICTKNEEYEMAAALQKEKNKVIAEYLKKKRASRTLNQKLRYFCIKIKRRFIY